MLFDTYKPIIYDVSSSKKKKRILDNKPDVTYANTIAMPLLTLGFHKELYKTKDMMDKLNEYTNRKKIYLVTSLFEKEIDRREDDAPFNSIGQELNNFIESNISKKLPSILTRAYLKLWELITEFDLIHDKKNFTSGHLAEGPGSFIQATILYRDFLAKNKKVDSSKDKYYAVTLHSTNEYLHLEKEFIDYYKKEKPQRLHILETIPTKDIKDLYGGGVDHTEINKTDGDLTRLSTINIFSGGGKQKGFAEKCDLITADGGFDWKNENFQEQEAFRLIFGEILTALKTQKEGGHFVLKIFDTFTFPSLKLIELLKDYYKNVYIAKPFTSRISNAERYIVCKDFEGISDKDVKMLEDLLDDFDKNSEFNIINIFPKYKIDDNDLQFYVKINRKFALTQYVGMNNILVFLNLDNKNGSEYNHYHELQINASKLWNDTFLNNKKILTLSNEITKYIEHNNEKVEDKPIIPMMKFDLSYDKQNTENTSEEPVVSTKKTIKKVKKTKDATESSVISKPKKERKKAT